MKKTIIAASLALAAASAYAQVGAGVVGSLGANGAVSNLGTTRLGGDIGAAAQMNGADTRAGISADARTGLRTPRTNVNTAASGASSVDAGASGASIGAGAASGAAAATQTPIVSGAAWGSAQAGVQASGPDVDSTKDKAKNLARQDLNRAEEKRDKLENKGDKAADKTVDKI
jgi:hypothetical protein